ncbi:replication endonuclease [Pseudomonas migulae]|uniref:Replication endonuclease n=1 Tax=Pseudomonas migulae TaxID=78543 RepID=A0ABY8MLW2_9PSED|nr:replication endonuclease [Pseudomonas migulae]WGK88329.1 replication endonuclease [Pseudomonas migulae]
MNLNQIHPPAASKIQHLLIDKDWKQKLIASRLFTDEEVSSLSNGILPEAPPNNKPLGLRLCNPQQIAGITKDIVLANSREIDRLNFLEMLNFITPQEFAARQESFVKNLHIYERNESKRGIDFALPTQQAIKRACDFRAVKRQLVKIANEERINEEANFAQVGGTTNQPYCSDRTLAFRKQQQEITEETLSKIYVSGKHSDQLITLAELAQNQELQKFNRLYHLTKNIEQLADEAGLTGYFVTFTAPANFHPNPMMGRKSYDQANIRNAHIHIQNAWKLIRARLAKAGIPLSPTTFFGLRTVEMHQDGCAHWHLMIFTTPENFSVFNKLANKVFPGYNQWEYEVIDKSKGDAASYIFKYIAKAVDSSQFTHAKLNPDSMDSKLLALDKSVLTHAARVSAALKAQRIRQYQCFGLGNSLTKYRLINKIQEHVDSFDSPSVRTTLLACRMYNDGSRNKEGRNLAGFKNLIVGFTDHIKLVKEEYFNRFGEKAQRITGLEFDCGYLYELPRYDIHTSLPNLLEAENTRLYSVTPALDAIHIAATNEELDQLERETFRMNQHAANDDDIDDDFFKEQESTVTVIYSDPSKAYRPQGANDKRPTASDLLQIVKETNIRRYNVNYIDIPTMKIHKPPLDADEILALLSNW